MLLMKLGVRGRTSAGARRRVLELKLASFSYRETMEHLGVIYTTSTGT